MPTPPPPPPAAPARLAKLEMLRGFASLYVFSGHFLLARIFTKAGPAGLVFRFGQEAVMLFFLLSGFVIYFSTVQHADQSFSTYFNRRARRIYPIFILALLGSVWLAPGGLAGFPAGQLLGNLFMLQDFRYGKPGVWFDTFRGNLPLWSLSYEWWFYMLFFPIYRCVPPRRQIHAAGGLSIFGFVLYWLHPSQLALFLVYFVIWWSGVELARAYLNRTLTLASQKYSLCYCGVLAAGFGGWAAATALAGQPLAFGLHPVLELRHFLAAWAFILGGLLYARARWVGFSRIFGVFARFGPISYALYVLHYPLAVTATYLSAIPSAGLQNAGYLVITFAAAYCAEVPFQRWINRVWKTRPIPAPPAPP